MKPEAFEIRVRAWEKSMEDMLIEMENITDQKDLRFNVNIAPLFKAFTDIVQQMRVVVKADTNVYTLKHNPNLPPY